MWGLNPKKSPKVCITATAAGIPPVFLQVFTPNNQKLQSTRLSKTTT